MKVSVNEARLTDLWARNRATIQEALISKFTFGPVTGLFEKQLTFVKTSGTVTRNFDTIANFEDLVGKIMSTFSTSPTKCTFWWSDK